MVLILVNQGVEPLQLKSAANPVASRVSAALKKAPTWALLSLATNVLLLLSAILLLLRDDIRPASLPTTATNRTKVEQQQPVSELGQRHLWTYQQWVAQLEREAEAAAQNKPQRLTVLAGDSISLWFPAKLLPAGRSWLNQGISGETSDGLLKRLTLLDRTQPETVFVMIGINDLIRGVSNEAILDNQRLIIQDLRWVHPNVQIIVQSILPHSGTKATWEGRDRLLQIPNSRIRELNRQLALLAQEEGVKFLDLYSLFTDAQGNLRLEFSTDGLHLNEKGYLVWRSALQIFTQIELDQQLPANSSS